MHTPPYLTYIVRGDDTRSRHYETISLITCIHILQLMIIINKRAAFIILLVSLYPRYFKRFFFYRTKIVYDDYFKS